MCVPRATFPVQWVALRRTVEHAGGPCVLPMAPGVRPPPRNLISLFKFHRFSCCVEDMLFTLRITVERVEACR